MSLLFDETNELANLYKLANQPPLAAFVRPSGVGGVEASWKDDLFPCSFQKITMVKG